MTARSSAQKHWVLFTIEIIGCSPSLISPGVTPSADTARWMETTLLVYVSWLARSYISSTVSSYVAHVKASLARWLGYVILSTLGLSWDRVNLAVAILRRTRPVPLRTKRPFLYTMLVRVATQLHQRGRHTLKFLDKVIWTAMVLCFNQLLRGNEVAQAATLTFANRDPMTVTDVTYRGTTGVLNGPSTPAEAQARKSYLRSATVIMPPSKADPEGRNLPLYLPAASGGVAEWLAPATQLFLLEGDRLSAKGPSSRYTLLFPAGHTSVAPLTTAALLRGVHRMCKSAGIDPANLGTHCFRIGGVGRLQDLGASVPQIMALGRWCSDAYVLYSRRSKEQLMVWSAKLVNA